MNISQMMRSLLGDVQSGDSKKLELKPGQVVRGVVTQLQGDQEAVVQINGVQVRAKLETPIAPGQSTMLRVQPESTPEQIVLKPVDLSTAQMPDDTVRQFAKAAGLPDTEWAMSLIKQLKQDGIPMTREVAQALKQAFQAMPKGADPQEWMQAAAAALKRGMPMTEQTVSAMRQVMFGKPLHELIDTLNKQLGEMTIGKDSTAVGTAGQTDGDEKSAASLKLPENALSAALRVKGLLTQTVGMSHKAAEDALRLASDQAAGDAEGNVAAETAGQRQAGGATQTKGSAAGAASVLNNDRALTEEGLDNVSVARGNLTPGSATGSVGTAAGSVNKANGGEPAAGSAASGLPDAAGSESELPDWIGRMLSTLGVSHENKLLQAATRPAAAQPADAAATEAAASGDEEPDTFNTARPADVSANGRAAETLRQSPAAADVRAAGLAASTASAAQAGDGIADEGQAASALRLGGQPAAGSIPNMPLPADGRVNGAMPPLNTHAADGMESLKSALLSLAAMDDMPASVRETAQQLIHQITGQQLMLAPERSGTMLTHVTMFIPLYDQDGGQTASVHVQTRRGSKNELDASNCRLLFDLKLKAIGETLVDVHVVDNIVNLNVWNDHPAMQRLAEDERGAVAEALSRAGYQLLTFKVKPMPDAAAENASFAASHGGEKIELPPVVPPYGGVPYKGVDYRI
ncbi:hypothetical protein [Paenibacillus kobensis]|uniref:hypothetical protein n=1 Tax=Paenibacillus kobensis TaxID=59841 RepID=UPI000FD9524C|nr:hypothetical protein [Paenibacillus kobensis]